MKKSVSSLSVFFIIGSICIACLDQPDFCSTIPETTAVFKVTEGNTYEDGSNVVGGDIIIPPLPDQDKVLALYVLQFRPNLKKADSYKWSIGGTTGEYKDSVLKISFQPSPVNEPEPWDITLEVKKKKVSYTCYQGDDSVKTYTRRMYVYRNPGFFGQWRAVRNDVPQDTIDFNIDWYDYSTKSVKFGLYEHFCGVIPGNQGVSQETGYYRFRYKFSWNACTELVYVAGGYLNQKEDTLYISLKKAINNDMSDKTEILNYKCIRP